MTLHLLRGEAVPAISDGDWVVHLDRLEVLVGEAPGTIDHDRLVELVFTAERVITW